MVDKMVVKWVDRTAASSVVLKVEVMVVMMVDILADPKVDKTAVMMVETMAASSVVLKVEVMVDMMVDVLADPKVEM
jgi:hypothetical protein